MTTETNEKLIITNIDEMPIILSAKHLQMMGLPRTLVYNLFNSENFPTLRLGKRVFVAKDSFLKWASENLKMEISGYIHS